MRAFQKFVVLTALVFASTAQAVPESSTSLESHRSDKKLGLALGIVGQPYPSIFGYNVSYNIKNYLRANLGYGEATVDAGFLGASGKVTTLGAGITGFVPDWNFSPTAGLHVSSVKSEGNLEIQGFEGSGTVVYGALGIDWQSSGGFNLGAGYNIPFGKGSGTFYTSLGWFFDVN